MPPRLFRVIVPVSDIEAAVRFYDAVLDVRGTRVSPGRHYYACGDVVLACLDARADGDGYDARPGQEPLYLAVDDLRAAHSRASSAGARFLEEEMAGAVLGEVADRPWGERSFYVYDPFGNPLCFVQKGTEFRG